jgi:hypothetical protein
MLLEKAYTPLHESGSQGIRRKFRDAGLKGEDAIGGFNTFTAICDDATRLKWVEASRRPLQLDSKGWEKLWADAGIPCPGGLPSGTRGLVIFQPVESHDHGRVQLKSLKRDNGMLGSTVTAAFVQGRETNSGAAQGTGTFTAVVIPATLQWTFTLESGTPFATPDLVTRALNGQPPLQGAPKKEVPLSTALKRVAGVDTSPEALGMLLLKTHLEGALGEEAPAKCTELVHQGADLTLRDQWGQTIFMKAAGHGHLALTALLIAHGADIDAVSSDTGHTGRQMAQDVVDNVRAKGTLGPQLQASLLRFEAVVKLIDDTQAARNPAPAVAAVAEPVVAEDTGPVKVRRPLSYKKPS